LIQFDSCTPEGSRGLMCPRNCTMAAAGKVEHKVL
jgi:hypothetical protein